MKTKKKRTKKGNERIGRAWKQTIQERVGQKEAWKGDAGCTAKAISWKEEGRPKEEELTVEKKKNDRTEYFRKHRAKKRSEMSRQKQQAVRKKERGRKRLHLDDNIPQSSVHYAAFGSDLIANCSPKKKRCCKKRALQLVMTEELPIQYWKGFETYFELWNTRDPMRLKAWKTLNRNLHQFWRVTAAKVC